MKTTSWPICCGAAIISDFGFSYTEYSKQRIYNYVKNAQKGRENYGESMLYAILNHKQARAFLPILISLGFEVIDEPLLHTGHGNHLIIVRWHARAGRENAKMDINPDWLKPWEAAENMSPKKSSLHRAKETQNNQARPARRAVDHEGRSLAERYPEYAELIGTIPRLSAVESATAVFDGWTVVDRPSLHGFFWSWNDWNMCYTLRLPNGQFAPKEFLAD